jgi:hypothetical protein
VTVVADGVERRVARRVLRRDVALGLNERLDDAEDAAAARDVQRRVAALVWSVHVGLLLDELADDRFVRRVDGVVERAKAAPALGLEVRAALEERRHDGAARRARSPEERVTARLVLRRQHLTRAIRIEHGDEVRLVADRGGRDGDGKGARRLDLLDDGRRRRFRHLRAWGYRRAASGSELTC